ncbi:MAG: phosphopentomutase [Flavobacteriales bacterium]
MNKRVVLIVLDSVGVGELPDAEKFGDVGSHTLGNIARLVDLKLPNLCALGLGNITPIKGLNTMSQPKAYFGKALEKSQGKDTSTGHWEISGVVNPNPFPSYPSGFPIEFIREFETLTGKKIVCNQPYSGTQVINVYGEKAKEQGDLILYTSADPVLQIAAHTQSVSIKELYGYCELALELSKTFCPVARVIARPFIGEKNGDFERTSERKDFSVFPPGQTILDVLTQNEIPVIGVGKIADIFAHRGISYSYGSNKNNDQGVDHTIKAIQEHQKGLIFTNLVDFDSKYGHRRNVKGYAQALEAFDQRLPEIIDELKEDDLLIITADHGCDPSFIGTDHTREYIPILVFNKRMKKGNSLGIRNSFADIGATIEEYLLKTSKLDGHSFLSEMEF